MLWLALHLPLLSLEAFCATLPPAAAARPVALLARHRISHVNPAAAACGVRPGMQRATALALAAELMLAQADPARDAAALAAVAHAALACTPAVTLHDAQTVLLEVQASLRLFGGLAALQRWLADALAPLGHRVLMAAAPTALGAALLARWQPPGLPDTVLGDHATQLPALQALLQAAPLGLIGGGGGGGGGGGSDDAGAQDLQAMGLHTLADLAALPRAGLARRFGQGLLDDLDRALGRRADPRRWVQWPENFEARLELPMRAEDTQQVLYAAAVLLARLVAWAQARHARIASCTLHMLHERQHQACVAPTELHLALAVPALDAAHLQSLLRERLAQVRLAAPTLELRLSCRELVPGHAPSGELFPTPASQAEGLTRLLERLRARLGDEHVQALVPVADHRPERASRSVPASGAAVQPAARPAAAKAARRERSAASPALRNAALRKAGAAAAALPLHRPAWLLPEPLPLAERDALPLLQGEALQLLSGPERIEAGWWDGAGVARDYFIAQTRDGSLVWIFRGRLPSGVGQVNWYLQGRFG